MVTSIDQVEELQILLRLRKGFLSNSEIKECCGNE